MVELPLEIIRLTSKKNMSFGYVKSKYTNEELSKMDLYIEVAKEKYLAVVELKPLKDKKTRLS